MSTRREIDGRRIWTAAGWLVLATLAAVSIALEDVSVAIGVGVAAVWALCLGFFPAPAAERR